MHVRIPHAHMCVLIPCAPSLWRAEVAGRKRTHPLPSREDPSGPLLRPCRVGSREPETLSSADVACGGNSPASSRDSQTSISRRSLRGLSRTGRVRTPRCHIPSGTSHPNWFSIASVRRERPWQSRSLSSFSAGRLTAAAGREGTCARLCSSSFHWQLAFQKKQTVIQMVWESSVVYIVP